MPLVVRNHAGQRGVRSNTHLIISAELRAVLACVRQTLAASPQPVSDNPLVPQLHRTLGLSFPPRCDDASRPLLLDSQPRVSLGPSSEHKRYGTAYRTHFIVDAVLTLRALSGCVTSQKLWLQLVRSLGVLISLLVAADVSDGDAIHIGGDREMRFDLDIAEDPVTSAGLGGKPMSPRVHAFVAMLLPRMHAGNGDDVGTIAEKGDAADTGNHFRRRSSTEFGALR